MNLTYHKCTFIPLKKGRQYLFLPKITEELEKQTCEKYFDGNLEDELDDENLEEMSDQELVDYLSTKSIDELKTDKYKPFINKVKNACDEDTFKMFYAKERG